MTKQTSRRSFMRNSAVLYTGAVFFANSLALSQTSLAQTTGQTITTGRLPLFKIPEMDMQQLATYELVPTNLSRAMIAGGSIGEDLVRYGVYFNASVVDPVTRTLAAIRTAAQTQCDYVKRLYIYHARTVLQMDEGIIKGAATDSVGALSSKHQAMVAYIDESIANGRASDEVYFNFKDQYTDQEVATITLWVGYVWQQISYAVNMDVPLDDRLKQISV